MAGTRKRKAPSSPCCWVAAKAEIISPMPSAESRKRASPAASASGLPVKGTPKPATATVMITEASSPPMMKPGSALPSRISHGR